MIDEEVLEKHADPGVIADARDLYYSGHCGTVSYTPHRFHTVRISCSVFSYDRSARYTAEALLQEENDLILGSRCSCGKQTDDDRICEHIAAAIMKYSYEGLSRAVLMQEEPSPNPISPAAISPVPQESSPSIRDMLAGIMKDEPETASDEIFRLIPQLQLQRGEDPKLFLTVRSGTERNMIIRDIGRFLDAVLNGGEYILKRQPVRLSRAVFTEESQPLIDLLKHMIPGSSFIVPEYYGTHASQCIRCNGYLVDELIRIAGGSLQLRISSRQPRSCQLIDGIPFLNIRMERETGGFRLFCDPFAFFAGESFHYLIPDKEDLIYRMKYREGLGTVLEALSQPGRHFIAEADLPVFTNYALPVLSSVSPVDTGDFHPEDYRQARPVFHLDLDLPQPDMISAEAFVEYNGEKYPLPGALRPAGCDMAAEKKMIRLLNDIFPEFDQDCFYLQGNERIFTFLKQTVHELSEKMNVRISDRLKKIIIKPSPSFRLNVSFQSGLLQLKMTEETLTPKEVSDILSSYTKKRKYYRLKNGDFIELEKDYSQLTELVGDLDISALDVSQDGVLMPVYKAVYFDDLEDNDVLQIDRDELTERFSDRLKHLDSEQRDVPAHLEPVMRGYQKKGFAWLSALRELGLAGLLADEMGLGKTLQVISFLSAWKDRGRTLIVTPASLVFNWASELRRFSPALHYTVISGPASIRQELIRRSLDNDILITSYTMLQKDLEVYRMYRFDCHVIDEAQYIKNPLTGTSKAVKSIDSAFRIALTGTPVENRLSELWSIFDFLLPGLLRGASAFREEYEKPILLEQDEEAFSRLKRITSPFILRRVKKDVLPDLPEKIEEIVYAPLEEEQSQLYEAHVQNIRLHLLERNDGQLNREKIEILAELTKLRQICCDPSLLYSNYHGNSAKENICMELIFSALSGGHKVLLFSQFTSMLDILTAMLRKRGISYHLLTGETPQRTRMEMIESFSHDDIPVFCISLKAGGTGINLTAADIVIHYDPWWNTAVENQATDRAHRIGQENPVTVYKIIMQDTIEERIIDLQNSKAELAGKLLEDERMSSASLSREDLMFLLKR